MKPLASKSMPDCLRINHLLEDNGNIYLSGSYRHKCIGKDAATVKILESSSPFELRDFWQDESPFPSRAVGAVASDVGLTIIGTQLTLNDLTQGTHVASEDADFDIDYSSQARRPMNQTNLVTTETSLKGDEIRTYVYRTGFPVTLKGIVHDKERRFVYGNLGRHAAWWVIRNSD